MSNESLEREHDTVYRLLIVPLTQEQMDALPPEFCQALRAVSSIWERNEEWLRRIRKERQP